MKLVLVLVSLFSVGLCLENGLGLTPPMGWMNWERFRCITNCDKYPDECISERLFMEMADIMVAEGYKDAGYEYVNIDDCWAEMERDEDGKLVANKQRFPNGIKYLADYIHSKGLKFGLYGDYGTHTCAGYPGSIDHLEIDADTIAEWGVDFWKFDGCYAKEQDMELGYVRFGKYMNKTGRPIMYSCSWPAYQEPAGIIPDYALLKKTCNLWRNWDDIDDSLVSVNTITDYFAKNQDRIQPHGGPGHWNDPDTLLTGNFGLSYDQSKAQMAIWAILAAPFLLSNDLRKITPEMKALILNKEVIAIDQDDMGVQGKRYSVNNNIETWIRMVRPIFDGKFSYAVAFVSRRSDGAPYSINVKLSLLNLNNPLGYKVTDLFNKGKSAFNFSQDEIIEERINPSGVNFYHYTPIVPNAVLVE